MFGKKITPWLFLFVLAGAHPALAQDEEEGYGASVSLGYVGTTGNTETQTFNTEVLYSVAYDRWSHAVKFQGLSAMEDGTARAERYYLENKSDYDLGESWYGYLRGSYTDDRFSGFDYQAATSVGAGHYFQNSDDFMLEGYSGLGYRYNAVPDDFVPNGITGSEGEMIWAIGENLEWQISDTAALTQSLVTEIGTELTVTKFEIGLVTEIMGSVSAKVAFQARNNSKVPAGREKTDTQTSINLVYEF